MYPNLYHGVLITFCYVLSLMFTFVYAADENLGGKSIKELLENGLKIEINKQPDFFERAAEYYTQAASLGSHQAITLHSRLLLQNPQKADSDTASKALVLWVLTSTGIENKGHFLTVCKAIGMIDPLLRYKDEREVAQIFLKSQGFVTGESWYNIGILLGSESKEMGRTLSARELHDAMATCFEKSGIAEAQYNLGVLLSEGKIQTLGKHEFKSQEERDQKAADYFIQSKTPEALYDLGFLMVEGRVSKIGEQELKSQTECDQKAADYFIQSKAPEALFALGVLLVEARITKVGEQEFNSQVQRDQAVIEIFKNCGDSFSLYNLAVFFLAQKQYDNVSSVFHILEARGVITKEVAKELQQLILELLQLSSEIGLLSGQEVNEQSVSLKSLQRTEKELKKHETRQQRLLKKFEKWKSLQRKPSASINVRDLLETSLISPEEDISPVEREIIFDQKGAPLPGTPKEAVRHWAAAQESENALKAFELIEELLSSNFTLRKGMPEKLKEPRYKGCWSLRIGDKPRVIYKLKEGAIRIRSFDDHYGD